MCHIETTAPEQAVAEVAALYRRQSRGLDYVPNYARLFSHRPGLMAHVADTMHALKSPLEPRLWLWVNLAAARASRSEYCSLAFAHKLLASGVEARDIRAVLQGDSGGLPQRERAAMAYAAEVARSAAPCGDAAVRRLRECGFSDTEIFDLAAAAAWRCFFARIPAALGARPDAALRRLEPQLHALLISSTEEVAQ